ncbi:ATPase [Patescibacteria group bacterium]|nr:ATPase [Patescibacteria group bacterium]
MSQKPIREALAKQLIADFWPTEQAGKPEIKFAAIGPPTKLDNLETNHPWLKQGKIVVKVDELFGKRGKLGYVKIAESFAEARKWIEGFRGKEVMVGERTGVLNHFLIEPYIEHKTEYYLAFSCEREHDIIHFSDKGGIEVDDQGESMQTTHVKLDEQPQLETTIQGLFQLFRQLDLPYLEFNPITEVDGKVYLLDTVARVDTCAAYRQSGTWGSIEIPQGFGTTFTEEEKRIQIMDANSGSSLKFVLLNPKGRIWTMVAGGGASIIYADAITAHTDPKELANYGEWSGNPTTDEMEAYTSEILSLIEQNSKEQALIIGGGIANFTDVKRTFAGIIKSIKKHKDNLNNLKIFVRRAGPRDKEGLKALQEACDEMNIPCVTHGAELPMTDVVKMTIDSLSLNRK